jgi:hypothetical protein
MRTIIKINDRITWVVADSTDFVPGSEPLFKRRDEGAAPIIPTKEEEWILKNINILWEKTETKVKEIKLPRILAPHVEIPRISDMDWEVVGIAVGGFLQAFGAVAASFMEVMVASMLSSICW